ncbi:MAG: putative secretion system ATPase PilM-like [Candidatus Aminicenantes bacterium]|nr:putative secretion system ATPase PilM-like [Candidatus Aminicenantes bacterium]
MRFDFKKVRDYFLTPLCPPTILQLSSSYVSGIHTDGKDGRARHQVVLDLPAGILEPHFDRKNIVDPAALSGVLKEGLRQLGTSGKKIACLLPEACLKILVLPFDSLPSSEREREKIIRWRAKKQMAVLADDARLTYEAVTTGSSVKVLVALARMPVIREYEDLFAGLGFDVGIASSPTVSLLNLVDWEGEKDLLLANIEEDSLGLVAVTQSEPALYRLKTFPAGRDGGLRFSQKIEAVVKEIEYTAHFIEDREKRQVRTLWFRSGLKEGREDIRAGLRTALPFDVRPVLAPPACGLDPAGSAFLAPLAGQFPWPKTTPAG